MKPCIFCKISSKEIPGHIIFEDDNIVAFLDISQTTEGHTLIIPKKHVEDVFSMSETDMADVFSAVPKIANALKKTFNATGINIVNNNGPIAGQTVFHYHVHLIPRYSFDDSFDIKYTNNMSRYSQESLAALKESILENM